MTNPAKSWIMLPNRIIMEPESILVFRRLIRFARFIGKPQPWSPHPHLDPNQPSRMVRKCDKNKSGITLKQVYGPARHRPWATARSVGFNSPIALLAVFGVCIQTKNPGRMSAPADVRISRGRVVAFSTLLSGYGRKLSMRRRYINLDSAEYPVACR